MSPTTVSECIKHLESAELLKVQRAKGKPTVICVLHDLKDVEDRFGLEDEDDEEFEDSELEHLPDFAKDAIRAWREDTADEDSEQREGKKDIDDRVSSRGSTLPDDEDSIFDVDNIPF